METLQGRVHSYSCSTDFSHQEVTQYSQLGLHWSQVKQTKKVIKFNLVETALDKQLFNILPQHNPNP